jgi:hypothetical protein
MGNNDPFRPDYPLGVLGLIGDTQPQNALSDYVSPTSGVSNLVRALLAAEKPQPPASTSSFGNLAGLANPIGASDLLNSNALTGDAAEDLFGSGLRNFLNTSPPSNPPSAAVSDLLGWSNALTGSAVFDLLGSPTPAPLYQPPVQPKPVAPTIKRKAFFSFHYDDIWRVNVVRNVWKITHPHNELMRSFYDSSLWESKKLEGPEAIKRLIRDGVSYTSAICVLAGAETWLRQWVRYEIARAIIDGRGLLTVHLNSIKHHVSKTAHSKGPNPLDYMAIGKVQEKVWESPRYYLFERQPMQDASGNWRFGWLRYNDYTLPVDLPRWAIDPQPGYVTPLSYCAAEYDYIADNGHQNIGSWIDQAAKRAGR